MTFGRLAIILASTASVVALAQSPKDPDWTAIEAETMQHYQAVLRLDTRNPPGNEIVVAEYVKGVLDKEGIPAVLVGSDPKRPNLIARLKGNGRKKPILIMGHSDTVTTDEKKWTHPPLSATRDGGYVYGRGTIDDKDNLTASLMTMILLKRLNVPLDRDVIFVSEAGEEGGFNGGIAYLVKDHFPEIEAEYCLAEGGGVTRIGGEAKYATVQTLEKIPRGIELVSHGISGHGSIPLKSNAIVHLAGAVAKVGEWRPDVRFNETTGTYFRKLAAISPPDVAKYYRDVLSSRSEGAARRRRLAARERAAPFLDAANVGVAEHLHRRLPLERHSLGSEGDTRRARAARRGSGEVPRVGQEGRQRSGRGRPLYWRIDPAGGSRRQARLGSLQGARRRRHARSTRADAADDEHRRDRHGATARQGRAVLRHRPAPSTSRTRRRGSARTAIRSGCSRASCTASCVSTGT